MRRMDALLLAALVGASGCSDPGRNARGGSAPTVRDSAGVTIVENEAPSTTGWQVEEEPLFTVGWDEGGPLFTWPQSGRILADGGALIGAFGEGKVHRIGPDGSVVATWGRKGEGPGEYQALDALLLRGDSIVVTDGRLRRITILGPEGGVRTGPLAGTFLHRASAVLADDRLLLVPGDGYGGIAESRPEWVFQTQPILAVDLRSGAVDTLAELPHLRRWYGTRGASPGPLPVKGRAGGFAEGFAWARSDVREVRWYSHTGRLVQVARWEEEAVLLSSEWREAMRRAYEDAYASRGADASFVAVQLAQLEEGLDRHEGPLPYWDQFHVDRTGSAWLSRYVLPGQAPERWRVVDGEGVFRGWVDLPGVLTILDVTDDRVLAVARNDLDEPAVLMLELDRGR